MIAGTAQRPEELVEATDGHPVIAHDAKSLGEVPRNLVHDTEVAAYLLEPARRAYPFRELCEERGLATDLADQAAADARLAQALAAWQREEIRGRGLTDLLTDVELPIVRILREMEQIGVRLDTARLHEISERVKHEADGLEREIYELAGEEFTLGSPRQLEEILFGKLGLSRKRRGKTGYSTDARVLQAIRSEHEIIPKIERLRELTKLAQTYLDALPLLVDADSRLHTTFNQTAATTGRLSSNNPNLQNIPIRTPLGREIRACFVAAPGDKLVSADYSQVELRLLAHIAGEDVLKEIFRRGEDVHTATACRVFNVQPDADRSRDAVEVEDDQLRDRLRPVRLRDGRPARHPAGGGGRVHRALHVRVPGGRAVHRGDDRAGHRARLRVDPVRAPAPGAGAAGAPLGPAQAGRAIRRQHGDPGDRRGHHEGRDGPLRRGPERAGLDTRLVLQIHDELLFEGPEDEAEQVREIAVREMADAYPLDPPLAVEAGIGDDWLSAK